jgi:hypothetical protein
LGDVVHIGRRLDVRPRPMLDTQRIVRRSLGLPSAGRVSLISSSLQDAPVGANLVLLLLDDKSECS